VAGQIVEAFGEAVALDVLARRWKDAGEVLRGDARLPVCLREGDAPDAGAARHVEYAQALRVAPRAERRGGSTRRLAVDDVERSHEQREKLFGLALRLDASEGAARSDALGQVRPGVHQRAR